MWHAGERFRKVKVNNISSSFSIYRERKIIYKWNHLCSTKFIIEKAVLSRV